jgi:hypothetical protein
LLIPTATMALALVGQFIEGKDSEWTDRALRLREDALSWIDTHNEARRRRGRG